MSMEPMVTHRTRAIAAARAATDVLAGMGVTALVTGSLANGEFGAHSDIDFLVTKCPRELKYAIEGVVEDLLGVIPFDVVYLEEVPAWKLPSFTVEAVDARHLR